MARSLKLIPAILFVACLFYFAPEARADNVVITSGFFGGASYSQFPGASLFSGQGLTFSGQGHNPALPTSLFCQPCLAGQSVNLSAQIRVDDGIYHGPVVLNGVNYPNLWYLGTMNFTAPSILVGGDSDLSTYTVPFVMTGSISGFLTDPFLSYPGPAIFSTTLSGQGFVTYRLTNVVMYNGVRLYWVKDITYTFQPAAVPEPASLLLLGTGLAGIAAARRRKRRRASCQD